MKDGIHLVMFPLNFDSKTPVLRLKNPRDDFRRFSGGLPFRELFFERSNLLILKRETLVLYGRGAVFVDEFFYPVK